VRFLRREGQSLCPSSGSRYAAGELVCRPLDEGFLGGERAINRRQIEDYFFVGYFPYAVAADAAALIAFVSIGLFSHGKGLSLSGYAHDALPVLGGWFAAALLFGLYRRPSAQTLVRTWLVGVTAAIAIRALVLFRLDRDDAVFLLVALCFTFIFVLGARAVLAAVSVRASWRSTTRSAASRSK
jgi:Protein of unknown function (DUF3054)